MPDKIRVIHYLNQFFAGVGGEEKGGVGPAVREGPVGPGRPLQQALGERAEVVATLFCGDNYFAERQAEATEELLRLMAPFEPQLLVAGPAFEGGRYGVACGALCLATQERLGIPVVTGMDQANPGADLYRRRVYIVASGSSAARMAAVLQRMAVLGLKLAAGEPLGRPDTDDYLPQGIKRNEFAARPPAERAVDMLLAKLRGEPFQSEIQAPRFQRIAPASPLRDLASATIALVTDGGLVPVGNPDRMEPGRAVRFTTIPIAGVERLDPGHYDVYHSGFDTAHVNRDPHRLVPLDVARDLEREGAFGRLHDEIFSTGGAHTEVENASRIGRGIAEQMKAAGINAVVLTST